MGDRPQKKPVGRESEAHPAFRIILSPDAERHHLPPTQGYKYHIVRNGERLNKVNLQPSSPDRVLTDCSGWNPHDAHNHARRR